MSNLLEDIGLKISMRSLPSHDRLQKIRGYFDPVLVDQSVLWIATTPDYFSLRWWWRNWIQRLVLPLRYRRLRAELKEAESVIRVELLNSVIAQGLDAIDVDNNNED